MASIQYEKDPGAPTYSAGATGYRDTGTTAMNMHDLGQADARSYYEVAPGAKGGTFAVTALTGGIAGLIPAIACSSTTPADSRLGYPDDKLMQNKDYRDAYRQTAKKMKQRKVWAAYGYGILAAVLVSLMASALSN